MTAPRTGDETSSPRLPDTGPHAPAVGSGWQYAPAHYVADEPQRSAPAEPQHSSATWSFTQQDLVSRDDTVTLVVPTDWWDETSPNAGHVEGTGDDFSVTPDVEASSPDDTMYVAVWADRRPEDSSGLAQAQQEFVEERCRKDACSSRSASSTLTVGGHEAVQQTIQLRRRGRTRRRRRSSRASEATTGWCRSTRRATTPPTSSRS